MSIKTYSLKKDGNKKLSANFKVSEFKCKDGSDKILISDELVTLLQRIRDHFNKPITINSAYRNATYNIKIGGASKSQHVVGTAADIVVKGITPTEVTKYVEYIMPNAGGIGLYNSFTHVDVRANRSRWKNSGKEVSVSGFPGYVQKLETVNDVIDELGKMGVITDFSLWATKLKEDKDAYSLACNAVKLTKQSSNAAKLETANDIVWELGYRTILTNTADWVQKLEQDKDLYWLAYKICNNTKNKTAVTTEKVAADKKSEPFKYKVEGITHIVEVDSSNLAVVETQCSTKSVKQNNFVNGTFFMQQANGKMYPLGITVGDGKVYSNYITHDKPVATLIIYKNGSVEMKYISDITKEKDVKLAISGYGIYPNITATQEGFTGVYSDVLRSTNRPIIGYRKKDNKIVIAVRSASSAQRANTTAKNLGMDFAISLDAGGSTTLKVDGKYKFKGDGRKIFGGLTWK